MIKFFLNILGLTEQDRSELPNTIRSQLSEFDIPMWKCLRCGSKEVLRSVAYRIGPYYCQNCTHLKEKDVIPLD